MKHLVSIFVTMALLISIGCTKKKETVPALEAVITNPYQEIDSTAMYFYNGGRIQWKLISKHMKKVISDTGHIVANPVLLCVYDSLGKEISKVISDSGTTDNTMKTFCVWGNVFVKAQNGVRVKATKLNWDIKSHLVTSSSYVQLQTINGDVLRGKGLEAAEDFAWWKFLHDVSGRFPNFKERIEKGETF